MRGSQGWQNAVEQGLRASPLWRNWMYAVVLEILPAMATLQNDHAVLQGRDPVSGSQDARGRGAGGTFFAQTSLPALLFGWGELR
jgi:hypothetical protein